MATVKSRIAKGRNFQKKIMLRIKEAFSLGDDDIRTPVGCETGEDVILSRKAREKVNLTIECKNQKRLNIWKAIDQCLDNKKKIDKKNNTDVQPAVIIHKSEYGNKRVWIVIDFDHYLELRKTQNG